MPVDAAQSDRNLDQAARESLTAHAFLPSLRSAWTGVDARPHMVIFWKEEKTPSKPSLDGAPYLLWLDKYCPTHVV
jgi:hypothetical protein